MADDKNLTPGGWYAEVSRDERRAWCVYAGEVRIPIAQGIRNEFDAQAMASAKKTLLALTHLTTSFRLGKREITPGIVGYLEGAVREACGTPDGNHSPTLTDAQRLAHAVLTDDEDAALPLADEVQMSAREGVEFVSREELIERLEARDNLIQRMWIRLNGLLTIALPLADSYQSPPSLPLDSRGWPIEVPFLVDGVGTRPCRWREDRRHFAESYRDSEGRFYLRYKHPFLDDTKENSNG